MSTRGIDPVPIRTPVAEQVNFVSVLHREIVNFLNQLRDRLLGTSNVVGTVDLEDQSAAVTTTDVPTSPLQAGAYRLSYQLRVTRAATTSSSTNVTLGWTFGAVSCSQIFTYLTSNTTATQTSDAITVNIDAGTPITYAVTYSSAGATAMQYGFTLFVESWPT